MTDTPAASDDPNDDDQAGASVDLEHEDHEPDAEPEPLSPAELADFDPGPDDDESG